MGLSPARRVALAIGVAACVPLAAASRAQQAEPLPLPSGGSGVEGVTTPSPGHPEALPDVVPAYAAPLLPSPTAPGAFTPASRAAFDGVIDSPASIVPPDTNMAVGPGVGSAGRVVMVTNAAVQIWDKTGLGVAGPVSLDAMFGATDLFDPKILYDQHSGRFFIVCLEGRSTTPGLSRIHIAVSSSSTPSDLASDWTFLDGSAVTTVGGASTWSDYPGLGADASALFVTANLFTFAPAEFRGIKIRVFDKAALIAGTYAFTDIDFDNTVTRVRTTQPAHVFGTTTNGGF